jgi:hypothetical protein
MHKSSAGLTPCPSGKSNSANQNKFQFIKPSREKYSASVFRKDVVLSPRPASIKRGERVVTIVGRDAMDAQMSATTGTSACGKSVWFWRPWAGAKFAR